MPRQMILDLPLGLGHEAKTDAIPHAPGNQPDPEGAGEPERVEQRRTRTEFAQTLARPHQVIALLARRLQEFPLERRVGRGQRLRFVERLRAHLADVVDAHQGTRQAPLRRLGRLIQITIGR